jgi:hypothetical protein
VSSPLILATATAGRPAQGGDAVHAVVAGCLDERLARVTWQPQQFVWRGERARRHPVDAAVGRKVDGAVHDLTAIPSGGSGARLLRKRRPGEPERLVCLETVNSNAEPDGSL